MGMSNSTHVKITSPIDFSATTVTVEPVTAFGRKIFAEEFGHGACSVELKKSGAIAFLQHVERKAWDVAQKRILDRLDRG
tara:strand:- start:225 stop:464 length:240 start_codon:yes stop_codon:yes gene_type:complete